MRVCAGVSAVHSSLSPPGLWFYTASAGRFPVVDYSPGAVCAPDGDSVCGTAAPVPGVACPVHANVQDSGLICVAGGRCGGIGVLFYVTGF